MPTPGAAEARALFQPSVQEIHISEIKAVHDLQKTILHHGVAEIGFEDDMIELGIRYIKVNLICGRQQT